MVQIVFAETVPINTDITKQAQSFETIACKAKGRIFSPKELEGTPVRMFGDALVAGKEVERRRRARRGFDEIFLQNQHTPTHTYTHLACVPTQRRKEERGGEGAHHFWEEENGGARRGGSSEMASGASRWLQQGEEKRE